MKHLTIFLGFITRFWWIQWDFMYCKVLTFLQDFARVIHQLQKGLWAAQRFQLHWCSRVPPQQRAAQSWACKTENQTTLKLFLPLCTCCVLQLWDWHISAPLGFWELLSECLALTLPPNVFSGLSEFIFPMMFPHLLCNSFKREKSLDISLAVCFFYCNLF